MKKWLSEMTATLKKVKNSKRPPFRNKKYVIESCCGKLIHCCEVFFV